MQEEEQRYEYRVRSRWEPVDVAAVPGLVRLRQPDSVTVHAGVLIDGWRLDSDGSVYSTYCGPKSGADRLIETSRPVTCKRCLTSNALPQQRTDVRLLIAWHASEIERLVRLSEL